MKKYQFKHLTVLLSLTIIISLFSINVLADNKSILGQNTLVNAGKDTGYSESNPIDEDDIHLNWKMGEFVISGYTRKIDENIETPIYLKNIGDTIAIKFELSQDILCLNGNEKLIVNNEDDGFDTYFGIPKTNFGRGTLIIRHTDYQNDMDTQIYTDFLGAEASVTANTEIVLREEGDYEVALNYEIKETRLNIFGWQPFAAYHNYRMYFKFSIRNGNCMVYPFDVTTGQELQNTSITENGFYLDLAKSRYLDIDIKKEVLAVGAYGLTEDIRFNRPAQDGEQYIDEGVYTITVSNRYTKQQTTKVIYVGTNNILKAYVTTGLSISEIQRCISEGGIINDDGTITMPVKETNSIATTISTAVSNTTHYQDVSTLPTIDNSQVEILLWVAIGVVIIMGLLIVIVILLTSSKRNRYKYGCSGRK